MRLDKFSNPVFNQTDLFKFLYEGHESVLVKLTVDPSNEIEQLEEIANIKFTRYSHELEDISLEEYDEALQSNWFMPEEFKQFDIESWVLTQCTTNEQLDRVTEELAEFRSRNMINVLKWLRYFVHTCQENNILWGAGRGSSVASYILYLMDVHCIDSIKYNLDWREFLR